jgi:hypothetical protein
LGIENGLHWCLDVTFGEDASSIRLRNVTLNFSFLRRVSVNLFRHDKSRSTSLSSKRKAAAWNPDDLATVLQPKEIGCSGPAAHSNHFRFESAIR